MATTTAELALMIQTFVEDVGVRDEGFYAWATGTATGGPNGTGDYPITDFSGHVRLFPSIAKIAAAAIQQGQPGEQVFVSARSLPGIALNSNIETGGGTDDTAVIQAALDGFGALGRPFTLAFDGVALVTGLALPSNCAIHMMPGAGMFLKAGSNRPILANANPTRDVTYVGTEGDFTINGGNRNIELIGGTYNCNGANQSHYTDGSGFVNGVNAGKPWVVGIAMYGVDGYVQEDVTVKNAKTFNVHLASCRKPVIRNYTVDVPTANSIFQDGLHFNGPCWQPSIDGMYGKSADDFLAFNADDGIGDMITPGNPGYNELGPNVGRGPIIGARAVHIRPSGAKYGVRQLSKISRIDKWHIEMKGTTRGHVLRHDQFNDGENFNDAYVLEAGNFGSGTYDFDVTTDFFGAEGHYYICGKGEHITLKSRKIVLNPAHASFGYIVTDGTANIDQLDVDLSVHDTGTMNQGTAALLYLQGLFRRVRVTADWLRDGTVPVAGALVIISNDTNAAGSVADVGLLTVHGTAINRITNAVVVVTGALREFRGSDVHLKNIEAGAGLLYLNSGLTAYPRVALNGVDAPAKVVGPGAGSATIVPNNA
jgi:hypothetical protein